MTDTDEGMVLCGRGLDKWYGAKHERRQVLFGVDVDVRAGECLAVIGGSGSGKTTLTRVLLGLESADGGSVEYCGEPVRGDVARKLRMQSGLVFQSPFDSLDPRWRIGRSIGEPLRMHHPDWPRERVAERVAEVLEMVSSIRKRISTVSPSTCPAGRRSARRSPAPSWTGRRCCSPTSR